MLNKNFRCKMWSSLTNLYVMVEGHCLSLPVLAWKIPVPVCQSVTGIVMISFKSQFQESSLGQKSHAAASGRVRTEDWRPPSLSLAAGQAAAATLHTTNSSFCSVNNISHRPQTNSIWHLLTTLDNVESWTNQKIRETYCCFLNWLLLSLKERTGRRMEEKACKECKVT